MKRIIGIVLLAGLLANCGKKEDANKFSVTGDIKNLPAQKVFLDEIYFGNKEPETLDTAEAKNGKFELSAIAPQEGMYRVRFEKSDAVFLVINDSKKLSVAADINNLGIKTVNINSVANASLKNFITETNKLGEELNALQQQLSADEKKGDTAAATNDAGKQYQAKENAFRDYVFAYADTCSSPTLAIFALGYVAGTPGDRIEKSLASLSKKFPGNNNITAVSAIVNEQKTKASQPPPPPAHIPQPGDMAPEITMPDTEGKMFSLSSLRGKYVLVDFWASWCGPCRAENPNVAKAYNKYSNKNFTVLGVSLDRKKEDWLEAIKQDGLSWKQISDLKQWETAARDAYQFEAIPYNVLVDPQGKILATSLRGEELDAKLAEILK